jgi:hypothetical protein
MGFDDEAPPKPKPEDINRPLPVSLEDLFKGCTKKLRITRRMLSGREEEKIVTVNIKAGWKKGTKIRYDGMGTEVRGGPAADVVCESLTLLFLFQSYLPGQAALSVGADRPSSLLRSSLCHRSLSFSPSFLPFSFPPIFATHPLLLP